MTTKNPGRGLAFTRAYRALVKRLSTLNTGDCKRIAAGSAVVNWQTLYRIGRGETKSPHVGVLLEIERLLDR